MGFYDVVFTTGVCFFGFYCKGNANSCFFFMFSCSSYDYISTDNLLFYFGLLLFTIGTIFYALLYC